MNSPDQDTAARLAAARDQARRAAQRLALDAGAEPVTRPVFPGSDATVRDVAALAGARAARDLELAARRAARDYIRAARQDGHHWHQIAQALGLPPGAGTTGEAAYDYAAGPPDPDAPWRPRSFTWTCPSCDQAIADHGPDAGTPADAENGHASSFEHLARRPAEYDAEWDSPDSAAWHAGHDTGPEAGQ